jgi:hypothetical protein
MPPRASVEVEAHSPRALPAALALLVALAHASPLAAQSIVRDTDRIDITGRQNLTLGSGARAYGMGGAFLSRADDATAASWNPAGLSYLRDPELTLVGAHNSFSTQRGLENDDFDGNAVDFAAFTWPIGRGDLTGAVQVSYQRAISFDGRRDIEIYERPEEEDPTKATLSETWDGSSDGGFDVLAFGTGLRLSRKVRAGFTVNRWLNGYEQNLNRTLLRGETRFRPRRQFDLDFRPKGWSFNLGLIVTPVEMLNIGLVYKTPFRADVELGKSRRDQYGTLEEVVEITSNSYEADNVRLDFPSSLGFGLSLRPRDELTISADYTRTGWSEAEIVRYFDLEVTPASDEDGPGTPPPPTVYGELQYPTLRAVRSASGTPDPLRQGPAEQIRLGAEWVLLKGSVKVPLRLGYFSDRQITPNPTGEAPRFDGFTAGVGLALGSMLLDFAWVYEFGEYFVTQEAAASGNFDQPTPQPPPLRYSLNSNRAFASIIYRFGGSR